MRIFYLWDVLCGLLPLDRDEEPISAACERLNILRMVRKVAEGSPENPDSHIDAMVKIDDGVIWPKPISYFPTGYNLASSFDEHSQNLKWLLPEKGFAIAIYYSCRVELTGTEIDLEGSEPDTTCAMILNWHLELWAEARCWAEQPQKKLIIGGRTPARLVFIALGINHFQGQRKE